MSNVQVYLISFTRPYKIHYILVHALPPIFLFYLCKCCPNSSMPRILTLIKLLDDLLLSHSVAYNSLWHYTPLLKMLLQKTISKKIAISLYLYLLELVIHLIHLLCYNQLSSSILILIMDFINSTHPLYQLMFTKLIHIHNCLHKSTWIWNLTKFVL